MKKRIMSVFLTLSLCIGLTVPASAAGTTVTLPKTDAEPSVTFTISNVLDTYKITLPMEEYVAGELVSYNKDECFRHIHSIRKRTFYRAI
jgi:hypothetical protein